MSSDAESTPPLLLADPDRGEDEIHYVRARDGWRLTLHRYRPLHADAAGEPVLLHHGLGANATLFDLGDEARDAGVPSLARWLARQGFDVWACELRGSGHSEHPGPGQRPRWDWSIDDMIHHDDPAVIDFILQRTGHERLHWVGHSLGGILALCHCCLFGSSRVASATVIAGGLDYWDTPSDYHFIVPLKGFGRWLGRVPAGLPGRILWPLGGRWANSIESFHCYPGATVPEGVRAIYRRSTHDVAGEALAQLATLFEHGGLRSCDHGWRYADSIDAVETPMLLISGDRDRQCSPAVIERTLHMLPTGGHRVRHFGTDHGHAGHYGHFDLLCGRHAEAEVFPEIGAWLQEHPAEPARHAAAC